jgi:hypothetical protein
LIRSGDVDELDWQPFTRRITSEGAVDGPQVRLKLLRQRDKAAS